MVSLAICAASWLVYDVLFLCLFVFLMRLVPGHAYSYDTYILVVRCMKQNKDAVWSLVLLLVTGVRADPKYSYYHMYVREDCYSWFFVEIVHFFSRYLVVGNRYDFFFRFQYHPAHAGRMLFDTKRKRENSRVWPFEVRVMLLIDRSRAWMILTGTQLWIARGHTTVVSHS